MTQAGMARDKHCGTSRRRQRGFSLAELMIAFAVLAMGLLIIGAALPVGVRYTEESVNLATGAAAGEYALDLLEQNLCILRTLKPDRNANFDRMPCVWVPRSDQDGYQWPTSNGPEYDEGDFIPDWEPIIKVRPLCMDNIKAAPGGTYGDDIADDIMSGGFAPEVAAGYWLRDTYGAISELEGDVSLWLRPAMSALAGVYPPVETLYRREYADWNVDQVLGRKYTSWEVLPREREKAMKRLISWTAFYRRVSYAKTSDPTLYELIVVVTRRPTEAYRFPVQEQDGWAFRSAAIERSTSTIAMYNKNANDRVAPEPWLITFTSLPQPNRWGSEEAGFAPLDRYRNPLEPATLTFEIKAGFSPLLPVHSIIIPARNDSNPSYLEDNGISDRLAFGPHAPSALPIYEVVERPSETQVVVKYNGFYPRIADGSPSVQDWPAWIIPPAFEELEGNPSRPVYSSESPILSVHRRFVHLRESE